MTILNAGIVFNSCSKKLTHSANHRTILVFNRKIPQHFTTKRLCHICTMSEKRTTEYLFCLYVQDSVSSESHIFLRFFLSLSIFFLNLNKYFVIPRKKQQKILLKVLLSEIHSELGCIFFPDIPKQVWHKLVQLLFPLLFLLFGINNSN